jgi:hypothetical protein
MSKPFGQIIICMLAMAVTDAWKRCSGRVHLYVEIYLGMYLHRMRVGDQILSVDGVDVAGLRSDIKELLTNNNNQVPIFVPVGICLQSSISLCIYTHKQK